MRRSARLLGLLALILALTGCGAGREEERELTVFAAASMEEALTEVGARFCAEREDVVIRFNFDSSGTLKTQIEAGAQCDVFLSAGQKQMNELEASGLLWEDSRFDLLENRVVLAVPDGNPKGIGSYDGLKEALERGDVLLAMGNGDVPVGQYTQSILAYFGLEEEELARKGCLTYGSNVKEVVTHVREGAVDCGILYATDAASAGLTVVDRATEEMCGRVIYPAAILKVAEDRETAEAFLAFLVSEEGKTVLESVGFSPVG